MPVLRIITLRIQESQQTQLGLWEILIKDNQDILKTIRKANLENDSLKVIQRSLVNLVKITHDLRLNPMKDLVLGNFSIHHLLYLVMAKCEVQAELWRMELQLHMITLVNLQTSTIVLLFHHQRITLSMTPQSWYKNRFSSTIFLSKWICRTQWKWTSLSTVGTTSKKYQILSTIKIHLSSSTKRKDREEVQHWELDQSHQCLKTIEISYHITKVWNVSRL